METLEKFIELFKKAPVTSVCGVLFALAFYISNNKESIAFLPDATEVFVIGLCDFIRGAAPAVGLLFAAQVGSTMEKKEVIPQVLAENQPEGKKELIQDVKDEIKEDEKPAPKTTVKKKQIKHNTTK